MLLDVPLANAALTILRKFGNLDFGSDPGYDENSNH
jgi:hypothetical protein